MIAFVRGVIAAATAAGSMSMLRSSISTRIGLAFAYRMASTVAKNVCDTVMTSSPDDTPHARMASCSASVPEPTPIECLVPQYAANSWSNARTFGPMVSCMLSRTSSIAARTSSRIVAYCALRSTSGISCVTTVVIARSSWSCCRRSFFQCRLDVLAMEAEMVDARHEEMLADPFGAVRGEEVALPELREARHERAMSALELGEAFVERPGVEFALALGVQLVEGRGDAVEVPQVAALGRPGRAGGDLLRGARPEALPHGPVRDEIADPPGGPLAEDRASRVRARGRAHPRHCLRVLGLEERERLLLGGHACRRGHPLSPQRAQRSSRPATGPLSERSRPQTQIQAIRRAGLPRTSACAGTSRVTTAPAPIIAYRPISRSGSTMAPAPIDAPRRTVVCPSTQSAAVWSEPSGFVARGRRSFVKTTCGPTNTPSSTVSPSKREAVFSTLHRSPITTPAPT